MWRAEPTEDYGRKHKYFEKKRPRELAAMLDNLDTLLKALNAGAKLPIKFGFLHTEPRGILAIDQKGGDGGNLTESRLYSYPERRSEIIHLLTIGDKRQQNQDIQLALAYVEEIETLKKEDV